MCAEVCFMQGNEFTFPSLNIKRCQLSEMNYEFAFCFIYIVGLFLTIVDSGSYKRYEYGCNFKWDFNPLCTYASALPPIQNNRKNFNSFMACLKL